MAVAVESPTTKLQGAYNRLTRTKFGKSAIHYALNPRPHNTDHGQIQDRVLATSYGNCTPQFATAQWQHVWTQNGTKVRGLNEVQRHVQSFSSDLDYHSKHDVLLANRIGYETGYFLYGRFGFQFMVITQADGRSHKLHNHILVNESNPITGKQLRGKATSINYVRKVSDFYLSKYHLPTMDRNISLARNRKTMSEVKLEQRQANNPDKHIYIWKDDLKKRIDLASKHATSWDQLISNASNYYGLTIDPYRRHKDKATGKKVITTDAKGRPKFKKHITYSFKGRDHKNHKARDRRLGTDFGAKHLTDVINKNHQREVNLARTQTQSESVNSNVVAMASAITRSAIKSDSAFNSFISNDVDSAIEMSNVPESQQFPGGSMSLSGITASVASAKRAVSFINSRTSNLTGSERSAVIDSGLQPTMSKSASSSSVDLTASSNAPVKHQNQTQSQNNNNNVNQAIINKRIIDKRKARLLKKQLINKYGSSSFLRMQNDLGSLETIKDIYAMDDRMIAKNNRKAEIEHERSNETETNPTIKERESETKESTKAPHSNLWPKRSESRSKKENDESAWNTNRARTSYHEANKAIKQGKQDHQRLQLNTAPFNSITRASNQTADSFNQNSIQLIRTNKDVQNEAKIRESETNDFNEERTRTQSSNRTIDSRLEQIAERTEERITDTISTLQTQSRERARQKRQQREVKNRVDLASSASNPPKSASASSMDAKYNYERNRGRLRSSINNLNPRNKANLRERKLERKLHRRWDV